MRNKHLLSKVLLLVAVMLAGVGTAWASGTLVSSLADLENGTYYITALNSSKYYTVPNTTISGQTFTCTEATCTNDVLTPANGAGEFVFTSVSGVDNAFYIYNTNLQKYLVATGSKTFGYVDQTSNDYGYWTFSEVSSGGFSGAFSVKHSYKTHYMRAYNNSVRCYDGTSNNGVYFFKKVEDGPEKQDAGLAYATTSYEANIGESFTAPTLTNPNNLTVTYASSTETVATVNEASGAVTIVGCGTTTITASFAGDDTYKAGEASYTLTVVDPNANDGSAEKPYTVAEAREIILAYTSTTATTESYYVKGIVSSFQGESVMDDGTYYRYYISDNGLDENELLIFKGKNLNNVAFTSADDVQIGDEVVICGPFQKYNSTAEMTSGNYIVSLKRTEKSNPDLSFGTTTTFNVNIDDEFTAPTLTFAQGFTGAVTYASNNEKVAMVDETTGEVVLMGDGTAVITASFTGNSEWLASSASYTINVTDPDKKGTQTNPYTVADLIAMEGIPATTENVWVKGWMVGFFKSGTNLITTPSDEVDVSNTALADNPTETGIDNVIAASFSKNAVRDKLNLKNNPWNMGVAQVMFYGKLQKAFGKVGLSTVLVGSKKIAEQVSITAAGMATYYTDCALDFAGLDNMWAYTATLSGDAITFTRINAVPAETGVLLYNPNNGAATNVVPVAEEPETVSDNKFEGTLTDTTVSGENKYILNNGSKGLGFYKVKASGSEVGAHRAYLDATGASSRAFIGFADNGATGIESLQGNSSEQRMEVYNLQGVRVQQPTKGLYIMNGKKVIFK